MLDSNFVNVWKLRVITIILIPLFFVAITVTYIMALIMIPLFVLVFADNVYERIEDIKTGKILE